MPMLDAENQIKKILEDEGVGCATAYCIMKKVMPIVGKVVSSAWAKGKKDAEDGK